MKVMNIKESGNSNLLRWAISNNADLKGNLPLASLINDDLFYLVTINDINFYQLLRLTQMYRNKIKVVQVNRATLPSSVFLEERFAEFGERVNDILETYMGLVTQMIGDDDIIASNVPPLFLPMLTTTFNIQIPFAFIDLLEVMSEEECTNFFNQDYPHDLERIFATTTHSLYIAILLLIEKNSRNIRYDARYEQLLKMTKYFVLLKENPDKLFKAGLLSFGKFDPVTRGEVKCNLFKADASNLQASMKYLTKLKSPLELSVAIQLPIYHMQALEASYHPEDLRISYRSSIANIVENGVPLNDFTFQDDPDQGSMIEKYQVRIAEANLALLSLISEITKSEANIHPESLFALLPPIYRTNAVITLLVSDLSKFLTHNDPVILEMFMSIDRMATVVKNDLQKLG